MDGVALTIKKPKFFWAKRLGSEQWKYCSFLGVVICERSLDEQYFVLIKNQADVEPNHQFELMNQFKAEIIKSFNILKAGY